jgi:hypothetical protein
MPNKVTSQPTQRSRFEVFALADRVMTQSALDQWFAIRHCRREVVHWSVTENPTAPWVVQQLREAFPFDEPGRSLRYLVFDRDTIFSAEVIAAVASMALEATRTSYQSPWQNGVAERFVGTIRRELLDHAIVLDDRHLRRLLNEYLAYYHEDRTHLAVDKARRWLAPWNRAPTERRPCTPDRGWAGCITGTPGARPRSQDLRSAPRGRGERSVGEEAGRSATTRAGTHRRPDSLPDDGAAGARPRSVRPSRPDSRTPRTCRFPGPSQ